MLGDLLARDSLDISHILAEGFTKEHIVDLRRTFATMKPCELKIYVVQQRRILRIYIRVYNDNDNDNDKDNEHNATNIFDTRQVSGGAREKRKKIIENENIKKN